MLSMAIQKNIIGLWIKNIPKKIKIPLERQESPYEKNTTLSVGLMIFSLTACAGSPRSDSAAPAADDSRVSEQKGQEEELGSAP